MSLDEFPFILVVMAIAVGKAGKVSFFSLSLAPLSLQYVGQVSFSSLIFSPFSPQYNQG